MENVRSDWTELAKQFQASLYKKVFAGHDVSDYIDNLVTETRAGKHDDLLIYQKRLRRPLSHYVKNVPPHVKAARLADQYYQSIGKRPRYQNRGTICYVITTAGAQPVEHQTSPLDYEHYIFKQLAPVADAILPFVQLDFYRMITRQLNLF